MPSLAHLVRLTACALAAALVGVLACVLAGCTDTGVEDVVALDDLDVGAVAGTGTPGANSSDAEAPTTPLSQSATPRAVSSQIEGAEALYSCLHDAGLPAAIRPADDGKAWVDWEEGFEVLYSYPDGMSGGVPRNRQTGTIDQTVEAEFREAHPVGTYGLLVDGVDHTDTFAACHEGSGYVDPGSWIDPAEELAAKQADAEITNAWIACARERGMPDLPDVTAVADNWATRPEVFLPLTTSAEELEPLVEACPTFDVDKAELFLAEHPGDKMNNGFWVQVRIEPPLEAMDLPTVNAELEAAKAAAAPVAEDSPESLHFQELNEILGRTASDFFRSHQ